MKKPNNFYLIVGLILVNFSLQSFNLLQFNWCNFYEFDAGCSQAIDVIVNKNIRFALHLFVIVLCLKSDPNVKLFSNAKVRFIAIASILFLQLLYFGLFFNNIHVFQNSFHKTINGLIFSPMIGIGLLAKQFFDLQSQTKK